MLLMRREIITSMLIVAVVASAGAGYLVGVSNHTQSSNQSCVAPDGSILYIMIIQDSTKASVTNATVDAFPVQTCNRNDITTGSGVTTIPILFHAPTNASGAVTIDASYSTYFSVTAHYRSQGYPFIAYVANRSATCATLSVPSGTLSVSTC
jgi:hypothetical protein